MTESEEFLAVVGPAAMQITALALEDRMPDAADVLRALPSDAHRDLVALVLASTTATLLQNFTRDGDRTPEEHLAVLMAALTEASSA